MWGKADDAGVLSPGKEENAALRKKVRKDWTVFKFGDYMLGGLHRNAFSMQTARNLGSDFV